MTSKNDANVCVPPFFDSVAFEELIQQAGLAHTPETTAKVEPSTKDPTRGTKSELEQEKARIAKLTSTQCSSQNSYEDPQKANVEIGNPKEGERNAAKNAILQLRPERDAALAEVAALNKELITIKESFSKRTEKFIAAKKALIQLIEERDAAKDELTAALAEVNRLRTALTQLTQERDAAEKAANQFKARLSTAQNAADRLREELTAALAERDQLREELITAEKSLTQLTQERDAAKEELTAAAEVNTSKQKALDTLHKYTALLEQHRQLQGQTSAVTPPVMPPKRKTDDSLVNPPPQKKQRKDGYGWLFEMYEQYFHSIPQSDDNPGKIPLDSYLSAAFIEKLNDKSKPHVTKMTDKQIKEFSENVRRAVWDQIKDKSGRLQSTPMTLSGGYGGYPLMWQNLNSVIQKCLSWFKPNSDPTKKETLQKYIKKIAKNHLKGVYTAEGVVRKVRKHGFPLCSYGEYCRHNKSCPKQKISQAPEAFAKFMVIATKPFIELCKIHSGMPLNQIHECIFEYFEKNMSDLFDDLPFIAKGFNYPQLKPFFKCTTEGCTYSVCSDWGHGIDIKEYDEPQ